MVLRCVKVALLWLMAMANSCAGLDDAFDLLNNPCTKMNVGGLICADCGTVAYCMRENNNWKTIEVAYCVQDNGYYCHEETKSCKLQPECSSNVESIPFECQAPGRFPDPVKCKYYHDCSMSYEHTLGICSANQIYSAAQKSCVQVQVQSTECSKKYQCRNSGDHYAWPDDPNIYYVCSVKLLENNNPVLYPKLYKCSDNEIYDGNSCQVTVSSQTVQPPAATVLPPSTGTICATDRLLPDGNDCRGYRKCSNGVFQTYTCPTGTYFDANKSGCFIGDC